MSDAVGSAMKALAAALGALLGLLRVKGVISADELDETLSAAEGMAGLDDATAQAVIEAVRSVAATLRKADPNA